MFTFFIRIRVPVNFDSLLVSITRQLHQFALFVQTILDGCFYFGFLVRKLAIFVLAFAPLENVPTESQLHCPRLLNVLLFGMKEVALLILTSWMVRTGRDVSVFARIPTR